MSSIDWNNTTTTTSLGKAHPALGPALKIESWISAKLGIWYRGQNSLDPVTSHQLPEGIDDY